MIFETWLSKLDSSIPVKSMHAVLELKAEGATLPFIARYRKEKTGNMDEVQIQKIMDLKEEWDEIINRQGYILGEIERQGKLTDELKTKLQTTYDKNLLEDLYLPFKQKRKSKATLAKEAGLEPLAQWMWDVGHGTLVPEEGQTLEIWAFTFKNEEKSFKDAEAAITGATDILIERLSEDLSNRQFVRDAYLNRGFLRTLKADKSKPNSKYQNYFDYEEKTTSLMEPRSSHRYLAIRRGWIEEELSISFGGSKNDPQFESDLLNYFAMKAAAGNDTMVKSALEKAARVALKAHVVPSIENEYHKQMKEVADHMAIQVFSEN
ncbi:MAG: RNA-binding transcriptional accessory protein, partial [Bdellovibrionales bacterium]|nr:RNA-binding transcriptional accessory protein [Oligoflexia bacterium]